MSSAFRHLQCFATVSSTKDTASPSAPMRLPSWTHYLAAFVFAASVVAFFWFIKRYGVNAMYADQWSNAALVHDSYSGTLSLSKLWAQHNENRILFPNLIVIGLARVTHYNILDQLYLSGVMLVAAVGAIVWMHRLRSPETPWLLYCPVVVMLLSFVQYGNTLSGFQLAWSLVLLALTLTLYLLDRPALGWLTLVGAITAAMVGSFSSLQGLIIWPAGLVLLYHRRRPLNVVMTWVVAAVLSTIAYFNGYNFHQGEGGGYGYVLAHPLATVKFFLYAIGDVVGAQPSRTSSNGPVIGLGAVILATAIVVLVHCNRRRHETDGSPLGSALICFGLLFAATVTEGRVGLGIGLAAQSRYTTFDLLIPIGCYLAVLNWASSGGGHHPPLPSRAINSVESSWIPHRARDRVLLLVIATMLAGVIGLQVVLGLTNGLSGGQAAQRFLVKSADVLVNIQDASSSQVQYCLSGLESPSAVRTEAHFLRQNGLGVFATSDASKFVKQGLAPTVSCT